MIIKYCSSDSTNVYGEHVFAVQKLVSPTDPPYAADGYTYVITLEKEPNAIWGCPSSVVIDVTSGSPVVRAKTNNEILLDYKPSKLFEIQMEKNRARDGGFNLNGVHYDSDTGARLAYTELAMRLQSDPAFVTEWKASDDTWVTMNAVLFSQMYTAGATHIANCFAWQKAREDEVNNASTLEELDAINLVYSI